MLGKRTGDVTGVVLNTGSLVKVSLRFWVSGSSYSSSNSSGKPKLVVVAELVMR